MPCSNAQSRSYKEVVSYYQLLGISPRASSREIKQAFRKQALRYHPDKNHTREAENTFKRLSLAYQTLSDPTKKERYDCWLGTQMFGVQDAPVQKRYTSYYTHKTEEWYLSQLMKHYYPYFKGICWAGLVCTLLLGIDYILPVDRQMETVTIVKNIYRSRWDGLGIYVQTGIKTAQGHDFVLNGDYSDYLLNHRVVYISRTLLLSKIVSVSPGKAANAVTTSLVYGNLFFVPLLLFITSLLGLAVRGHIELGFSFSIVSALLLILVCFLVVVNP